MTSHNGEYLEVETDGHLLRFPAVWLRDNCPCPECLDPVSGQKLTDVTELPGDLAVSSADCAADPVLVTYAPDGHRSAFPRAWLAAHALGRDGARGAGGRTEDDGKELWRPADLARPPEASWPRYLAEPGIRAGALDAVLRWGFVLLRDVPAEPGLVLEVAASFGFVRETNYGRLFDVRVEPRPGNLAFTSRRILPHTDNPYRDPVPTLQLLHCLRAAGDGGETGLVDGFAAYARWAALLARPERQLNLRLAPGDCLIFDNTRVLHARTQFRAAAARHLQGCYADLDGLASTLAVLQREETP